MKDNADTKIVGISLHGYASPEGSYANNTRLAEGRAEALKKYVMNEYGLSAEIFNVASTPEDWEGLRAYVEKSDVADKDEILAIIDADIENLDTKEYRMRAVNVQSYQTLFYFRFLQHLVSFENMIEYMLMAVFCFKINYEFS